MSEVLQDYIKQAVEASKEQDVPLLDVLRYWEDNVPECKGIVAFYEKNKNGQLPIPTPTPQPPQPTAQPVATQSTPNINISSFAQSLLAQYAEAYNKPIQEMHQLYASVYPDVKESLGNLFEGQELEQQAVFWVQAKLTAEAITYNEANYNVIILDVSEPFEATEEKEEPNPAMPSQKRKVKYKVQRATIHGIFTKMNNDDTVESALGKITVQNQEMATGVVQSLKPFTEYSVTLEGKTRKGYWNLFLKDVTEFEEVQTKVPQQCWDIAIKFARENQHVYTPVRLETAIENNKLKSKGQLVILEGRIANVFTQTFERKDGSGSFESSKMTIVEPGFYTGEPKMTYIQFWDKSQLYKYGKFSHVFIICWGKVADKEFGFQFTGQFIIPIAATPGNQPVSPGLPQGRGFQSIH